MTGCDTGAPLGSTVQTSGTVGAAVAQTRCGRDSNCTWAKQICDHGEDPSWIQVGSKYTRSICICATRQQCSVRSLYALVDLNQCACLDAAHPRVLSTPHTSPPRTKCSSTSPHLNCTCHRGSVCMLTASSCCWRSSRLGMQSTHPLYHMRSIEGEVRGASGSMIY
jgi:hypothetical protein